MASGIVESSNQGAKGAQGQGEQSTPGAKHSKLVQRLLTASASLPAFVNDLLTTQAVVVAGTEAAGFVLENSADGAALRAIAHIRPDNSSAETRAAALSAFQEIIKPCVAQGKDGAIEISSSDSAPEPQFCLVTLLRNDGVVVAASAVITRCRNTERAQQRLVSMQLVAGYFDLYTLKRSSEQAQIVAQSHQHVLQLATAVATAHGFESASMNLCNELSTRTSANRVTLGWVKGNDVRVVAFSHTEQFDKKQELVVELEKVMEECVDQAEPVHFEPSGGGTGNVSRAAQQFSRTQGGNSILSLPLRRQSEIIGVIVMEFAPNVSLPAQASTGLAVAVDLLAPQLYDRYQNDRWLITKTGLSIKELTRKVIGPQYMLAKTLMVLVAAAIVFLCTFRMTYHVSAPFSFAPVAKTTLSCPVDGYVESVFVRPGSRVLQGAPLLKLKTVELEKKLHEAEASAEKAKAESLKARSDARTDPSKMGDYYVYDAQRKAAQADADLYALQISEATIKAPADGVVLTGDLEDQWNSFKRQGEELFTFQATDKLRAELDVAENDIQEVIQYGKARGGRLATTSLPRDKFPFAIDRIDPSGQPKEGANVFKVYAAVPDSDKHPEWRPGMQGEANIDIEKRRLIWIWTHKFVDYVRLKAWTWM